MLQNRSTQTKRQENLREGYLGIIYGKYRTTLMETGKIKAVLPGHLTCRPAETSSKTLTRPAFRFPAYQSINLINLKNLATLPSFTFSLQLIIFYFQSNFVFSISVDRNISDDFCCYSTSTMSIFCYSTLNYFFLKIDSINIFHSIS